LRVDIDASYVDSAARPTRRCGGGSTRSLLVNTTRDQPRFGFPRRRV